ncbi:FkbM family methyltransferase [Tamlana agarivorans]|uniref:FkbM family methyltransferase n=1 Tax=Pseudotamlana agarivorans TaxID=481183 RepID=A0ACC5UD01_9FLAO|nr:FkbM family methyltransferase [Tamlana agarivorans]MBU2952159.1 FkbM family methyltransferase [Tamlana agarivorans]
MTKRDFKLKDFFLKAYGSQKSKPLTKKIIKIIKKVLHPDLVQSMKLKLRLDGTKNNYLKIPRYTETTVKLEGVDILIPDNASYHFMNEEIFVEEIYKFNSNSSKPYIIDGGANIGMATIYFKKIYPDSEIIAFEPDKKIFDILANNIKRFGFNSVKLINKGLWNENKVLSFFSEGADAGLLSGNLVSNNDDRFESIDVESLRPYLNRKVDFLKLDIEGSETEVLIDIDDLLINVEHVFVEYHSFVGKIQSLGEIVNILEKANFRLYISSPGLINKSPFVKVKTYNNMDGQLNIYGIKQS